MRKAFVLLSGGIDSTTCLHKAIVDFSEGEAYIPDGKQCNWVEAISINYGQRHLKESEYAAKTCKRLGVKHTILDIGKVLGSSMLTDPKIAVPNISYSEIKGVSPTYVPFRNGTLLACITAYAQQWVNQQINQLAQDTPGAGHEWATDKLVDSAGIYFGAHAEDAANWAYPDCTPEFIGAMANAIYVGTYRAVRLHTPIQWLNKKEIIQMGENLGVRWADTWSCYKGEEFQCGVCPTCRARRGGFTNAWIPDPTVYAAETGRTR